MRNLTGRTIALWLVGPAFFFVGCAVGQQMSGTQKSLMHVFAYTPLDGATPQDFDNFQKATGDLVGKIPGLKRAWVGKLREPIPGEADKPRTYGVAMEFDNAQALDAYAQNPIHTAWMQVYERVRLPGTTTLDILGQ